jgi:arginyl-tRNA--protein-N-Asp/Glu arginylyltransferase
MEYMTLGYYVENEQKSNDKKVYKRKKVIHNIF